MYIRNMVSIHLNITQASNLIVILTFVLVSHMYVTYILYLCNTFTESLTRTFKDQCNSIKKTHNILTHNIMRTSDKQLIQELN